LEVGGQGKRRFFSGGGSGRGGRGPKVRVPTTVASSSGGGAAGRSTGISLAVSSGAGSCVGGWADTTPGSRTSPGGSAARNAPAKSLAEAKRRSGSRAIARSTISASAGGTSGRSVSGTWRPASAARSTASGSAASNGRSPVSAS
jgi:hypothetical protein